MKNAIMQLLWGAMVPPDFADLLTLYKSGRIDYAHKITTGTSEFLDLPTALLSE